ncbi:MAG: hypothetical protein HOM11_17700 [Methylococcales bacterium]|jgi:hypothetical protein|nr:hypothetical protein [Methylococcales bacterium]MBT7443707.1 hypothetical protein [Methylococcales bacterium]
MTLKNIRKIAYTTILVTTLGSSTFVQANDNEQGGAEFRQTAQEFTANANKFNANGQPELAKIYTRLAEIKTHAATLADQNKSDAIDWTEYHALNEKLQTLQFGGK